MKVKNFYTANSAEPGDVFLVVLKATIQYDGTYRLYRCPYEGDDIPEGDRIYTQHAGLEIFPVLQTADGQDN